MHENDTSVVIGTGSQQDSIIMMGKKEKPPFTKLFYTSCNIYFKLFTFFSGFPTGWDSKSKNLILNRFSVFRFRVCVAFVSTTAVFYNIRVIPAIWKGDPKELDELGFGIALTFVLHFVDVICLTLVFLQPERVVSAVNGILEYSKRLISKIHNNLIARHSLKCFNSLMSTERRALDAKFRS
jgi:hypothetical protein